ncbi:hypothetical protein CYY_009168 [Polysphondylium violaceum]|uniref:IPT/TIG domain-containing protein n=1 Tax=Polysphondylium violaceum TaxID=133409 RepID=A0A8J4UWB1_9MYCE|nr:hypothetical protein CYY_009168 [Polysphondylium violaceum]
MKISCFLLLVGIVYLTYSCVLVSAQGKAPLSLSLDSTGDWCNLQANLDKNYNGTGEEYKFTSNNRTVPLSHAIQRYNTIYSQSVVLVVYLTSVYRPPLLLEYNNTIYDVTVQYINCIISIPSLTQINGESREVSIILDQPVNNETLQILVDSVLYKTIDIQLDQHGAINRFQVYFPYDRYSHSLRVKRVAPENNIRVLVSYIHPDISQYSCQRGFQMIYNDYGEVTTACNFTGNKLYRAEMLNGLLIVEYQVTLTNANFIVLGNLQLGSLFSLDSKMGAKDPSTTYFYPMPKIQSNQLNIQVDSNNRSFIMIYGSYLDAVTLNETIIQEKQSTFSLDCTYHNETSLEKGYKEFINCTIPSSIKNSGDATVVLKPLYYPNQPITLSPYSISFAKIYRPIMSMSLLFIFILLLTI